MQILNRKHKDYLSTQSDAELVLLYKQISDPKIVGELYERYYHILFGVCLKYMKNSDQANEALLEIFSSLYASLVKYDILDFKHWLLTVARNHCIKQLKANSKDVIYNESVNSGSSFMEMQDENDHHRKEKQLVALEEAIKELKPEQSRCIQLFFIESKSYHEIVDLTGFDLKKVKSYIQNGKRNLEIALKDYFNEEG